MTHDLFRCGGICLSARFAGCWFLWATDTWIHVVPLRRSIGSILNLLFWPWQDPPRIAVYCIYFFVIWSVNNLQSGKCPETGKQQNPLLRKSLGTPSTFFYGIIWKKFPNGVLPTSQSPSDLIFSRYCVVQDLMCVLVCISRLQYEEKLLTLHLLSFSSLCELECFLSEST